MKDFQEIIPRDQFLRAYISFEGTSLCFNLLLVVELLPSILLVSL